MSSIRSKQKNSSSPAPNPPTHTIGTNAGPTASPRSPLTQLQRNLGNMGFQGFVQARLKIGQANDIYEQEADRAASLVSSDSGINRIAVRSLMDKRIQRNGMAYVYIRQLQARQMFNNFIRNADGYGLPVGFLRRVGRDYTIRFGGSSAVNVFFNTMTLEEEDLESVSQMSPDLPIGESTAIRTIYEEATHAYLDLVSDEPGFSRFIAEGEHHYRDAPTTGGMVTTDPGRVFQEAAGTYVGHRAANWWSTFEMLSVYASMSSRNPAAAARIRQRNLFGRLRDDYNRLMAEVVFGYSAEGGFWGFGSEQVETTRAMSAGMKTFLDHELLEDKIPDRFEDVAGFQQIVNRAGVTLSGSAPAPAPAVQRTRAENSQSVSPESLDMVTDILRSPGRPLDFGIRIEMERYFGHDFGPVRVHTDKRAAESARALNALAYTVDRDIVFEEGRYSPEIPAGKKLLAHELTHVIQQSATRNLIQRRSRVDEIEEFLEFWDSREEARSAVDQLALMNSTDFNDTVGGMVASGSIVRLIHRQPSRADVVRFLQILANRGTRSHQEDVFRAVPMLNLSAENSLIVFGRRFVPGLGSRGPTPPPGLSSTLVSSSPSAPFTGLGATGTSPAQAPMGLMEMWRLRSQAREAVERFGPGGVEHAQYHRIAGLEMLYDWSNPIKGGLVGPGSYLAGLSSAERVGQAQLLFGREISTAYAAAYSGVLPTRIQVVRTAATAHNLEPELVAGIILAEQRDQSLREDAADYRGATLGGRSTSIGLGQVTVSTARREGLFADLLSPEMQRLMRSSQSFAESMIPGLLASDEFNIFAVSRYVRHVADMGSRLSISSLPNTRAWLGPINLHLYAGHSSTWTNDHIRLMGSEYTSRPFDDNLVEGWGDFVLAAYQDVGTAAIF